MSVFVMGTETVQSERCKAEDDRAIEIVLAHNPAWTAAGTKKLGSDAGAKIDQFFIKDQVIKSCAEVKARRVSERKFLDEYKGQWLLSQSKLLNMRTICDLCSVCGFGILYLVPNDIVLLKKLVTNTGFLTGNWPARMTQTQDTVYGGTKEELCCYIPMDDAVRYAAP
jgi:hypothetical protein